MVNALQLQPTYSAHSSPRHHQQAPASCKPAPSQPAARTDSYTPDTDHTLPARSMFASTSSFPRVCVLNTTSTANSFTFTTTFGATSPNNTIPSITTYKSFTRIFIFFSQAVPGSPDIFPPQQGIQQSTPTTNILPINTHFQRLCNKLEIEPPQFLLDNDVVL